MKNKVRIISCYYGQLPPWLDLWLLSCANNPEFDYLIVTDQTLARHPENVQMLFMSFDELRERFSRILGFPAALTTPYKLCDYKPLYGLAFQDELKGYDFWGHCDMDLIWGNLSDFVTDDLLDRYDRIGKFGHFILYRNTEQVNRLYQMPGGAFPYEIVFRDASHYGFDELTGINLIYEVNNIPYYKDLPIVDAERMVSRITSHPCQKGAEFYCWQDGKLYRVFGEKDCQTEQFAYLHFQKKAPALLPGCDYSGGFYIKANAFYPRNPAPFTTEELLQESEFRSVWTDCRELFTGQCKRAAQMLKKKPHERKIQLKKGVAYQLHRMGLWKKPAGR